MVRLQTLDNEPVYKRSQMLYALGKYHAFDSKAPIPSFYKHRLKRLIDIDRELDDYTDAPRLIPAVRQQGKGTDHAFTASDVFCLCIALEMLDIGFKQKEVVYSVRYLRANLDLQYRLILKKYKATDYKKYRADAETAVLLLFDKTEFVELLPQSALMDFKDIVIRRPVICQGMEKLEEPLMSALRGFGRSLVIELTTPAIKLTGLLADAPLRKRGVG